MYEEKSSIHIYVGTFCEIVVANFSVFTNMRIFAQIMEIVVEWVGEKVVLRRILFPK